VPMATANKLARVCAYSTHAPEWKEFVQVITPVVALTARRVSTIWGEAGAGTVGEIVQEVFLKLCEDDRRVLREFEDRGNDAFLKLLRVITASVATDYHRRARAEKRGGRLGAIPLDTVGIENEIFDASAMHAVEWPALMAQLDELLRLHPESVSARDRQMFWLYYRQGLSAQAIAHIPAMALSAKGVESALRRMAQLLREAVLNGRSGAALREKPLADAARAKGFAPVVAIDSVKRH
jgi:RNA polymerase sigma-70 factor, ECF subfamily